MYTPFDMHKRTQTHTRTVTRQLISINLCQPKPFLLRLMSAVWLKFASVCLFVRQRQRNNTLSEHSSAI